MKWVDTDGRTVKMSRVVGSAEGYKKARGTVARLNVIYDCSTGDSGRVFGAGSG